MNPKQAPGCISGALHDASKTQQYLHGPEAPHSRCTPTIPPMTCHTSNPSRSKCPGRHDAAYYAYVWKCSGAQVGPGTWHAKQTVSAGCKATRDSYPSKLAALSDAWQASPGGRKQHRPPRP